MTSNSNSIVVGATHSHWRRRRQWRTIVALLCASGVAAACDRDITRPDVITSTPPTAAKTTGTTFLCTASIPDHSVSCVPATSAGSSRAAAADVIGGQDVYVRLTSSGTTYDAGTQIFQTDVTVQSLVQPLLGTSDGVTTDGISVFFASGPTVTAGSGSVSVFNANGTGAFTGSNQPYFLYQEILEPYQISGSKSWQFSVSGTVSTFNFSVYVSTNTFGSGTLLDAVWGGTTSSDWFNAANWQTGSVPRDGAVVAVPRASLLPGGANNPTLSANDSLSALRVGEGSTLDLGGHRLIVTRNVDAPGTISNGSIQLPGTGVRIGGKLPSLVITGTAQLQRPTVATGAVSVTGALTISNSSLSISIP